MKGLLLKDFYMILKYYRSVALIVVVFAVVSVFSDNNSYLMTTPAILAGMIPQTLLAYDERAQWDKYSLIFPYSRKQLVSAKYILSLISVAIILSFSLLFNLNKLMNAADSELLDKYFITAALGLGLPAVIMPVVLKFGVEKGRIIYIVSAGALFAVLTLTIFISDNTEKLQTEMPVVIPIFIASTILFAISWLISIRIYEKREL